MSSIFSQHRGAADASWTVVGSDTFAAVWQLCSRVKCAELASDFYQVLLG